MDIWEDKNAWDSHFISSIKKAYARWKEGEPPIVFLPPDAREYTASDSVYAQLRKQ